MDKCLLRAWGIEANKNMKEQQLNFFHEGLSLGEIRVFNGDFFEVLSKEFFSDAQKGSFISENKLVPDLIVYSFYGFSDIAIEVKGSSVKYDFIIDVAQYENYVQLSKTEFPYTDLEVYYIFFVQKWFIEGIGT